MKFRLSLGSQQGRTRRGYPGSDWIELRSEYEDDGRTRRGVRGTEWWMRDGQVLAVDDRLTLEVVRTLRNGAGELLFTEVADGTAADVDVEEQLDGGRAVKVRAGGEGDRRGRV